MKIPALILAVAALTLTAAAGKVDGEVGFIRALNENDPVRRGEALLKLVEQGSHSAADLALIHLTRAKLPPKSLPQLLKISRSRFGDLIPAVLLTRAFREEDSDSAPEPMPRRELFRLTHSAWKSAAMRKLSPFEGRLFCELSGQVLKLAWECGETAQLFPEVEQRISARDREWNRDFPTAELLEFCYRHAFVAEGFELYSTKWLESSSPGRRTFAALLNESAKYPPRSDAEAAARIAFLRSMDEGDMAILLAAEQLEKNRDPARLAPKINMLVNTVIGSGRDGIFENLHPFLKPAAIPGLKALTLANGGKFQEALKMLPQISDAPLRTRVEMTCRLALGEFDAAFALANDPASPLDKHLRILALLEIAQNRRDAAAYEAAERLAGNGIDTDPSLANSFGYVALLLDRDRDQAEKRIRFALKLRPCTSAFLDSLAWARYQAGDHAEAWKYLEEALRCGAPILENCEMLAHAGAIRLALGDREGARRYCEKALKLAQAGEKDPRKKATIRPIGENIRKLLEQMK